MRVKTNWTITSSIEDLWPLLCDSKMITRSRSPLFRMGLPLPVQCRLPDGSGGVDATRQCVSATGQIQQRIVAWDPPSHLAFEMVETDLPLRHFVAAIREEFWLSEGPTDHKTQLSRRTHLTFRRGWRWVATPVFYVGLKTVHRFVFRNWTQLASAAK
jgi:hypothetical protein